ncbi:MAG: DUF3795 domain-containing protein [bacterium]
MLSKLIAPCGMNCSLCLAYQRAKNNCPGCLVKSRSKSKSCLHCRIKNCSHQKRFCFTCKIFPCARLKHLDKRYRTKYGMSMIENLEKIKKIGVRKFVKSEQIRWECKKCGKSLCVHRPFCLFCGEKGHKS